MITTKRAVAAVLIGGAVIALSLFLMLGQADPPARGSRAIAESDSLPKSDDASEPKEKAVPSDESVAVGDEKVPPILDRVDATTKARLEPWFQEYRAQVKGSEPITEYDFFMFDDVVVQNILSGAVTQFRFNLNKNSYRVVVDYLSDYESGQIIVGHLAGYPQGSVASIYVQKDGAVMTGSFQAVGSAMLISLSVPDTAYHVIFSQTGDVPVD